MSVQSAQFCGLFTIIVKTPNIRGCYILMFLSATIIATRILKIISLQTAEQLNTNSVVARRQRAEMHIATWFAAILQLLTIYFIIRRNLIAMKVLLCTTILGTFLAFVASLQYSIVAHCNAIRESKYSYRYPLAFINKDGHYKVEFRRNSARNNIFHEMFMINLDPRIDGQNVSYLWLFGFSAVFVGFLQIFLLTRAIKVFECQEPPMHLKNQKSLTAFNF